MTLTDFPDSFFPRNRFRIVPAEDTSMDGAFREAASEIVRSWPTIPDEELEQEIEDLFLIHYADQLQQLASDRTEHLRLAQECLDEAKALEAELEDNK